MEGGGVESGRHEGFTGSPSFIAVLFSQMLAIMFTGEELFHAVGLVGTLRARSICSRISYKWIALWLTKRIPYYECTPTAVFCLCMWREVSWLQHNGFTSCGQVQPVGDE